MSLIVVIFGILELVMAKGFKLCAIMQVASQNVMLRRIETGAKLSEGKHQV